MSTNPPGIPPGPRKTNPLVWILVAVGGLFLLLAIAVIGGGLFIAHKVKQAGFDPALMRTNPTLAITKMMAAANPDVEVVSVSDRDQKVTLRDKKTGKTITMNFDDAKNGKFVFQEQGKDSVMVSSSGSGGTGSVEIKSADGTVKIGGGAGGKVPTWIPDYPGSAPQGSFTAQTNEGSSGSFNYKIKDPADKVAKFYEDGFKSSGMKVTSNVTNSDGKASAAFLSAEDDAKTHTSIVAIATEGGETTVSVTYNVKK